MMGPGRNKKGTPPYDCTGYSQNTMQIDLKFSLFGKRVLVGQFINLNDRHVVKGQKMT